MDEKKIAETLKKDTDATLKKAKIMESQLKSALADHEAFQVIVNHALTFSTL